MTKFERDRSIEEMIAELEKKDKYENTKMHENQTY